MIDLMMYVIAPTIVFLVLCLSVLRRLQAQQKVAEQDEVAKKINDVKTAYKTTLEMLSLQRLIRPAHVNNLYAIVNNFFINQPINAENASRLEKLANRIIIAITKEANLSKNDADTEWLKKKLVNFVLMLPNRNTDYNERFYQERLKHLLLGLATTRSKFVHRYSHAA